MPGSVLGVQLSLDPHSRLLGPLFLLKLATLNLILGLPLPYDFSLPHASNSATLSRFYINDPSEPLCKPQTSLGLSVVSSLLLQQMYGVVI